MKKLKKNEDYLVLKLEYRSDFCKENINLDGCENISSPDFGKMKGVRKNLFDLIDYFCSKECLDHDNEWNCKKCKSKVSASKKFELYYLPRILIICINRFKYSGHYYSKNDEFIDFPIENLDLGKYVTNGDSEHYKYDLFAVSQHYGGTDGGHYTAVCKNWDGNWYDYNDSSCSKIGSDVASSAAYMLLYRKQNW